MSVIAKLSVRDVHNFGTGTLVDMGCVCENDLMANYAGSEEDKLFTKASPWGEARFNLGIFELGASVFQGDQFYAMLVHKDEPGYTENPAGSFLSCPARIASVVDYGGTSKTVNITSDNSVPKELLLRQFNWKMTIDNPGASNQLKPGSDGWWFSLFKAAGTNRNEVIAKAHGRA